jgi:hypothetical protein
VVEEKETNKPIKRKKQLERLKKVYDKVAVIIELQNKVHLINIIAHFLRRLDNSWIIQVFHGSLNEKMLRESLILKPFLASNEIILTNINKTAMNKKERSSFMLDEFFYNNCACSGNGHILVFGMESYLNDNPSVSINTFLKYDYVGAPFPNTDERMSLLNKQTKLEIGSGDLSLRKKSRMLQICSLLKQRRFKKLLHGYNDDMVISSFLVSPILKSVKLPTKEEANTFSSEFIYKSGSIGGSKPWLTYDHSFLTKYASECSDFKELFKKYLYKSDDLIF